MSLTSGTELAASMAAMLSDCLQKHGVDVRKAEEIGLFTMDEVRRVYGGQNVYFAKEDKLKKTERDREIFDRWQRNELSVSEIAREYGFSVQFAYRVIRCERARRKAEREAHAAGPTQRNMERWNREGGNGVDA